MDQQKANNFMIENFKDELLFNLSLESKNELTGDTICQLEADTKSLISKLDSLDENLDFQALHENIELAKNLIERFKAKRDNESLVRKNFYVTPAQLEFLDDYAKKHGFNGKQVRSLALRDILNKKMKGESVQ